MRKSEREITDLSDKFETLLRCEYLTLALQDRLLFTAGGQASGETDGQQSDKNDIRCAYSHIMKLTLIMKLVPGIG